MAANRTQLAMLLVEDDRWTAGWLEGGESRIESFSLTPDQNIEQHAALLSARLRERGVRIDAAVLALPSHWCVAATIQTHGLMRRGRRAALAYRFEDQLPLDAESLVSDYMEHADCALAVGTQTNRITPLLDALDAQGIPVVAVCPLALLAFEDLRGQADLKSSVDESAFVVIQHGDTLDLIGPVAYPRTWRSFPADPGELERELRRRQLDPRPRNGSGNPPLNASVITCGVDAALIHAIDGGSSIKSAQSSSPAAAIERAVRQAHAVAIGGANPPLNLRRDALAALSRLHQVRRPLTAAMATLLLLLAAATGGWQWRDAHYQQLTEQMREAQVVIYHQAFPNQPVPAATVSRLRAEATHLRGMSGVSQQLPYETSALHLLKAVFSRLPQNLRYRVLELRIDGEQLYIDGQALTHSNADALAASLRSGGGFAIESPRTEALPEQGVSFTLNGRWLDTPVSAGEDRP